MAIINKSTNNKCWWGCGEKELLCTVGENADWCSHCGKQYGDTSKKLKMDLSYDPVIPPLGIYLKKPKPLIRKNKEHSYVHCSVLYYHQDMEAVQVSFSRWVDKTTLGHLYNGILLRWNEKKKISPFVTAWMDLQNIMLCEISQSEKDKCHILLLICGI